jgi:hypothetical protein
MTSTASRTIQRNRRNIAREPESNLVKEVRDRLGISRKILGRLTTYSERQLCDWELGKKLLTPMARKVMNEMFHLSEALENLGVVPQDWLDTPVEKLGGLKPLEAIERGEVHKVWQLILGLQSNSGA